MESYVISSIWVFIKRVSFLKAQGPKDNSSNSPTRGPNKLGKSVVAWRKWRTSFGTKTPAFLCFFFFLLNYFLPSVCYPVLSLFYLNKSNILL